MKTEILEAIDSLEYRIDTAEMMRDRFDQRSLAFRTYSKKIRDLETRLGSLRYDLENFS